MKVKASKRALLTAILCLMLCIAMLIGTTYAWFTDSVTTGVNNITSGTLGIDIQDANGNSLTTLNFVKAAGHENEAILWEPGARYELEPFYIVNTGNLYLKFMAKVTGATGNTELLDVIDFTIDGTDMDDYFASKENAFLAPKGESGDKLGPITIKGVMDTAAGNTYQGKTITGVEIEVYATQANKEVDSIDSTYDMTAEYDVPTTPSVTVNTAAELQAALTPSISNDTAIVTLAEDITLADGEDWTPLNLEAYAANSVKNIVINGNGHTISGLNDSLLGNCFFGNTSIEINDLTLTDSEVTGYHNDGAGILIAYANHCASVKLKNCHITESSINVANDISGVGGLIGYCDSALTIENCSVIGVTVNGSSASAGAIVGAIGYTTANITDVTVANCTVKGERVDKTGYVIGSNLYCTSAAITTTGCSGNTVLDVANSDVIYGRYLGTNPFTVNGVVQTN